MACIARMCGVSSTRVGQALDIPILNGVALGNF